jgi:adenosylcobyric acid synthase
MGETPALMVQGTGSHVGKSLTVAGLCRLFANRGMRVVPFKPQNMSNNAAVAADGGEIGRAQALQARAARVAPSVHMNPVLLKPEGETGAQVVVQGKRFAAMRAVEYARRKGELLPRVLESFAQVSKGADLVLVEGAGSLAEVNLRAGDIANMGFAEAADVPVVLVADIERGGVIASLVGTHAVLPVGERARIEGFIVNKFRGDPALFDSGRAAIAARTGWPSLGVVPWFDSARDLPAEDSVDLAERETRGGRVTIAVPMLPRIANFDDLDPLRLEPSVSVRLVRPGEALPVVDLVLLPGSKSTISDLAVLRTQGWDVDIRAHVRRGGRVLGLCGGFQMLGRRISDPEGVEGIAVSVDGLGLLDVETVLAADKTTTPVLGRHVGGGEAVIGYEIHIGRTFGPDCARPLFDLGGRTDGATSVDGKVAGSYVHGIFASDEFRRAFLAGLGAAATGESYEVRVEAALDGLAAHLERHVDCDALLAIARRGAVRSATG